MTTTRRTAAAPSSARPLARNFLPGPGAPTCRPIIFSGESVRAILAGAKTQTRRVIRNPARLDGLMLAGEEPDWCPYGRPGDRLWVRETWRSWEERCDDGTGGEHGYDTPCGPHCAQTYVAYAATPRTGYRPKPDQAAITYLDDRTPLESYHESLAGPWRSPIHMPRWASRITLEIEAVGVQRLQEITDWQILAEGMPAVSMPVGCPLAVAWFKEQWDAINGKRAPWSSNPWVWALSFEIVK